jgi:hypothetical protein
MGNNLSILAMILCIVLLIACLGARFDVLREVRTSGEQSCTVLPL